MVLRSKGQRTEHAVGPGHEAAPEEDAIRRRREESATHEEIDGGRTRLRRDIAQSRDLAKRQLQTRHLDVLNLDPNARVVQRHDVHAPWHPASLMPFALACPYGDGRVNCGRPE